MDFLDSFDSRDPAIKAVVSMAREKNREFRNEQLSSRELNDISMQMFRVKAIAEMVEAATSVFVNNVHKMLNGSINLGFELIKSSRCAQLCSAAKTFDVRYGFHHRDVLKLELQGNNYIRGMMKISWSSISCDDHAKTPFERFVFGEISENYRRVFNSTNRKTYAKCQLLCDVISEMTESHLIKKHAAFTALQNDSA
jgi:dGTPase